MFIQCIYLYNANSDAMNEKYINETKMVENTFKESTQV